MPKLDSIGQEMTDVEGQKSRISLRVHKGHWGIIAYTRIMVYKGMVYKSKYWIFEKNKGGPVSICRQI